MNDRKTIILVLKDGKDFSIRDVELIARHIHGKWASDIRPRIICLWNKATAHYDLGSFELIPLTNNYPGTWSRIQLYSPEMDQYRPFLYLDLDTVVVSSLTKVMSKIADPSLFITLEDFWQKGQLATGVVWFPKESEKVRKVWNNFKGVQGRRMDNYIRTQIGRPDMFWQDFDTSIYDFKPRRGELMQVFPDDATLICLHGTPRIFQATAIQCIQNYVQQTFAARSRPDYTVTVIIPYNRDRGWLNEAKASVPENVQLILSKGDGNWPENFNKVLNQATGDYIRWLHEDDMLTPNCIEDSVQAIIEQDVDFIHGNAIEIRGDLKRTSVYHPSIKIPTISDLLNRNVLHSATLMYKRAVFEKLKMDETLNTAEEYEFNLRCLKAGFKIGYCDASLAYYRRHPQQKVRVVPRVDKDREREQVKALYR